MKKLPCPGTKAPDIRKSPGSPAKFDLAADRSGKRLTPPHRVLEVKRIPPAFISPLRDDAAKAFRR